MQKPDYLNEKKSSSKVLTILIKLFYNWKQQQKKVCGKTVKIKSIQFKGKIFYSIFFKFDDFQGVKLHQEKSNKSYIELYICIPWKRKINAVLHKKLFNLFLSSPLEF